MKSSYPGNRGRGEFKSSLDYTKFQASQRYRIERSCL